MRQFSNRHHLLCLCVLVMISALAIGCVPDFDVSNKDQCQSEADCLDGYTCVAGVCQQAGTPDVDAVNDIPGDLPVDQIIDQTGDGDMQVDTPPDVPVDMRDDDTVTGPDEDGDGIRDAVDNCRDTINPLQEDYDNNGVGDVCQTNEHTTLVISELMADPEEGIGFAVREWQRQYIELYNAGGREISLGGWVLENASGARIELPNNNNLTIPAGGHFVISGGPLSDDVHNYTHASSGFRLAKGEGADGQTPFEVVRLSHPLRDEGQRQVFVADEVRLLDPVPRGTALVFDQDSADDLLPALKNNDVNRWCGAWQARAGGRDGGSPGEVNGPCNEPDRHRCTASGGPKELPLDQHIFGDLSDPLVTHANVNRCSNVAPQPALSADLTYTVNVEEQTAVSVEFYPLPNISGDQNGGMVMVEPWLGMVYWREGECPMEVVTLPGQSVCLSPTDEPLKSNILLKSGVTYYFTIDGQRRSLGEAYEEGRFTFALIQQ